MNEAKRKKELVAAFAEVDDVKSIIMPMLDDVVFLEGQLEQLRGCDLIRINPNNPAQQRTTPAAKLYKELLQQYNNCIKILAGVLRKDVPEEESPLRLFVKRSMND